MKTRNGFVSNSSSTSFFITNLTDETKTIVDFVKENLHLVDAFNNEYDYEYTHDQAINSATNDYDISFDPNQRLDVAFGDEHGTVLGQIFDYILREGGTSESFSWKFSHWLR